MKSRNIVSALAVLAVLLLALAWYDGGETPLREIVQPVDLPGDMR